MSITAEQSKKAQNYEKYPDNSPAWLNLLSIAKGKTKCPLIGAKISLLYDRGRKFHGEALRIHIEDTLGYSQDNFARIAGLSATTIGSAIAENKVYPATLRKIITNIHLDEPIGERTVVAPLKVGIQSFDLVMVSPTWWCYHYTQEEDETGSGYSPAIAETEWKLHEDGKCDLFYGELEYEGDIIRERRTLFCDFRCKSEGFREHMEWRFHDPTTKRKGLSDGILKGACLGVDVSNRIYASPAVLSPVRIEKTQDQDDLLRPRVSKLVPLERPIDPTDSSSETKWDYSHIEKHLSLLEKGDTVKVMTPYLPSSDRFMALLDEFIDEGISFKILLFDPENIPLIQARAELLKDFDGNDISRKIYKHSKLISSRNTVPSEYFSGGTKLHTDALKEGYDVVELRYTSNWMHAMSFFIGKRSLCFSLLTAFKPAGRGYVSTLDDHNSPRWKLLESDFDAVWENAMATPGNTFDSASWLSHKESR